MYVLSMGSSMSIKATHIKRFALENYEIEILYKDN